MVVIKLNLNYTNLLPINTYEIKAQRICELYATKLRLTAPRAIEIRYAFPYTENIWPMIGLSIAEHSFMVAQLIVPTYLEFLDFFPDKNISPEKAESEALHHDDAEALTGDAATDVDGITRAMKDAAENKSIDRQYYGMVCHSYMRVRHESYEAKDSYLSKLVKVHDAIDLIFFSQYCLRNGVGIITRDENSEDFMISAFDQRYKIDQRTHSEVSPYFLKDKRTSVPISEIMYDHSLPRIEKLNQPELTCLFQLLCSAAFKFPFERFNLVHLPMDFAKMV